MTHVAEAARSTPVMHETDVLVVGGGPGGLAAALASARAGAGTMLIDVRRHAGHSRFAQDHGSLPAHR